MTTSYRGLSKVISGGQTGVDQGGLMAAWAAGVATGGFCPAGWRTTAGPNPLLAVLGLTEHPSSSYPPRTVLNIETADATLLLGFNLNSAGSRLTAAECARVGKPCLQVQFPQGSRSTVAVEITLIETIVSFIIQHQVEVLNVAGNRDSDDALPNYHQTLRYVAQALELLAERELLVRVT